MCGKILLSGGVCGRSPEHSGQHLSRTAMDLRNGTRLSYGKQRAATEWWDAHAKLGRTCNECGIRIKDSNKYAYCGDHTHMARAYDKIDYVLRNTKSRSSKQGIPFDLTRDTVPAVPDLCECCSVPLDDATPRNRPTLDKVIPHNGYVVGNVAWLCWTCNRRKDNSSVEQLRSLVAYIERFSS